MSGSGLGGGGGKVLPNQPTLIGVGCLHGYICFDSPNNMLTNLHPRFSGGLWKHILLDSSFENLRQPQH